MLKARVCFTKTLGEEVTSLKQEDVTTLGWKKYAYSKRMFTKILGLE
jgi:hypothetical protein